MTIIVRAVEPDDFEGIRETMSQPLAQANTLQLPMPSVEMWRKRLADPQPDHKSLVAWLDGKIVGNAGIHPTGPSLRRRHAFAIGMAVHDAYHRRGVGSALMAAIVDLGENWMQATRLELTVYTENEGAIALYKKFGFEIEGTLRRYAMRDGVYVDSYTMARLKK